MSIQTKQLVLKDNNFHQNITGLMKFIFTVIALVLAVMVIMRFLELNVTNTFYMKVASNFFLLSLLACCVMFYQVRSNYNKHRKLFGKDDSLYSGKSRKIRLYMPRFIDLAIFVLSLLMVALGFWAGTIFFIMSIVYA